MSLANQTLSALAGSGAGGNVELPPLRVCHLSLTLQTGGLERILADIARLTDRQRCVTEFVAIKEVGRFAEEIRSSGCAVHALQPAGRWGQIRQMVRLFRAGQFDVVHTHNTYPHLWGTLAARLAGVPVVVQTRHGQRAGHGWKSSFQYRLAARWVDRVITVSDDAARLSREFDRLPASKIQRIWNGIDLTNFAYRGPVEAPIAISVARLSAEKDFPTLIRAAGLAAREVPGFRLRIVGNGSERSRLEALAATEAPGVVEFLGERTDVPELLAQAGFFVTSSLTEGISLTLLEAMAVGLPVVATAVGGNPEIVVEGETGRLVPAADPHALARAMIRTCSTPETWQAMGQAGRTRVQEHFEARRMIADYEALYRRLLVRHEFRRR